ncbi:hypothetical protein M8C13_22550 [Crossiella sp. SN42]|uniref:hypothetical protein n=1 Tax=Crossiella sp. SN42 TaxID=2944808 RepID=UPI00207D3011|nr:hypothetical protein [Crossiella sp. SN42]MCO1578538.1 hypothetical protein [Crossiella sp. SN42]
MSESRQPPRISAFAQLAAPGALVGALAGSIAGLLALLVGQPPGWALVTALGLGLPLALLGGLYGLGAATGRIRLGVFAPAAVFWLIGFPLSRLIQEVALPLVVAGELRVPADLLGFLAYQGIVSAGFAIGFIWLHERLAPQMFRRFAATNPLAAQAFTRYATHAETVWAAKTRARANRAAARGA